MTAITQKIPDLIGGISQQPDELKPEGSLREALNVIPDVTDGLRKRTGSRLINPLLTTAEGSWFQFNYADNEKYIGKVGFDGSVTMFNCFNGLPTPMLYAEYSQPNDDETTTGYADCDLDAYNSTKLTWLEKKRIYDALNLKYNNLLDQRESFEQNPEQKILYNVQETVYEERYPEDSYDSYEEWLADDNSTEFPSTYVRRVVIEGDIRRSGPDIRLPNNPPEGYTSLERGSLKIERSDVYYSDSDGELILVRNAEVYELIALNKSNSQNNLDDLNRKIEDALELVNAAKIEMEAAYELFKIEAEKCGLSQSENLLKDLNFTDVVPSYLIHNVSGQIKTQVIGNRIFLVNPKTPVSMNSSGIPIRQRENFIEVTVAAAMQDYSLELVAQDTDVTPYTEVKEVDVIKGKFEDDDGQCPLQGGPVTETFNDGDKKNLTLELTVTGVQILTGNGNSLSDYECSYRADCRVLNPGVGWQVDDIVEMEVSDRKYKIRIAETEIMYTAEGAPITVPTTPNGVDTPVKAATILNDIKSAIEDYDAAFTCKVIGNGIWVIHSDPNYVWRFSTPNKALMNIVTDEVTSVVQLPSQCRAGYTVKVTNTESDDDDYYAIFQGEKDGASTEDSIGADGPGVWIETVKPGIDRYINPATMPHVISRRANGDFVTSPVEWEPRLVGDDKTNPKPGFIDEDDPRTIENIVLFRNRLCMLSGDTITCSRSGDYYNFWSASALTAADNDPVDIAVGSTSSSSNAVLTDAIEIGQGLVCFTGNEQYVLNAPNESFTPSTAKFSRVGTYRYTGQQVKTIYKSDETLIKESRGVPVFSLGTSVGFLSDSGLNSRLIEMFNIGQDAEASINELTKPVSRLLPYAVNLLADSKDNNLVVLGKRGSKDLWVYRYFDNDQRRVQSAWFKWRLPSELIYHCIMDDVYWHVSVGTSSSPTVTEPIISLQRIDLKDELATAFVYDKYQPSSEAGAVDVRLDNDTPFEAHLDNYRIAQPSESQYYSHLNQTYFPASLIYYKNEVDAGNLVAYMLSPTIFQRDSEFYGEDREYYFTSIGTKIPVRVEIDNLGTWFVMDGDWSNTRMMIGYQYDMEVHIPTIYPSKTQATNSGPVTTRDTRAYVNLHRLKINFGQVGVYETTLKVTGRDDYTELYECKTMDGYPANEVAFDQDKTQVVPVYAKNTDTSIIVSSLHPSPCTIHSLEWEGDYGAKWYKSV